MKSSQAKHRPHVPRILVVDDTQDNLFLMNALLEDRYEVVLAASGREALHQLTSGSPPDLVLLDVMMPDMDGYEVLRRIRQHPPTAAIPVIFLSALNDQDDERLGMDLGAVDYLTKPVNPEQVVRRVEAHMRATIHARRLEILSEKLSRRLSPEAWQGLFHGPAAQMIRFERRIQTILFAETATRGSLGAREHGSFAAEVQWLAARHQGTVDRYTDAAAVVCFDDPGACVRMAMDLQRSANALHLRMGVHTGMTELGFFPEANDLGFTLICDEANRAAAVAQTAATGSIAVSPETYAMVREELGTDASGCLLMEEFHDSDLAQVSLTPAPVPGETVLSTFAGLGR